MTRAARLCWPLAVLLGLPGCTALTSPSPSVASYPPCIHEGIVLVVDGAGGFEATSRTMRQTVAEAKLPLEIRAFCWTHGYCRVIADHMHSKHVRREGCALAERVLSCRLEAPQRPITLVGHSAGCAVVVVAAEYLPPDSVERIILLAPAVSAKRDLRPALRASCRGVDVFYSTRDWACLGIGTLLAGTTDRCWLTGAAGKVGFQPIVGCPADEALYAKLRQYPWHPSLAWTGHKGGHYGCYQPGFLRAFVLPLLAVNPSASCKQF